jgi:hypothetical protein
LSHATNNAPFGKDISVDDVVKKVKCELADALDKKTEEQKFKWMQSWTVKVDLTLQANEAGGITPSLTYVQPLSNAYFLGAGPSSVAFPGGARGATVNATPQNFNLGVGATYSGQAYRTETVSFSLSLKELKAWREKGTGKHLPCLPVGSTDLQGDLDLAPWIDSALEPVDTGDLDLGTHPAPGTQPKAITNPTPAASDENVSARTLYARNAAKNAADDATKSAQQANATKRQALASTELKSAVKKKVTDLADSASDEAMYATEAMQLAKKSEDDDALEYAVIADKNAEAAAKNAAAAKVLGSPNPPIDSISHSLNFVVTFGASVSPNWTLLNWKGPTNAGNLGTYAGIRTHTLAIALGSPSASTNTEAARVLNNDSFRQSIQSP